MGRTAVALADVQSKAVDIVLIGFERIEFFGLLDFGQLGKIDKRSAIIPFSVLAHSVFRKHESESPVDNLPLVMAQPALAGSPEGLSLHESENVETFDGHFKNEECAVRALRTLARCPCIYWSGRSTIRAAKNS
jgi:hypothetical protein